MCQTGVEYHLQIIIGVCFNSLEVPDGAFCGRIRLSGDFGSRRSKQTQTRSDLMHDFVGNYVNLRVVKTQHTTDAV